MAKLLCKFERKKTKPKVGPEAPKAGDVPEGVPWLWEWSGSGVLIVAVRHRRGYICECDRHGMSSDSICRADSGRVIPVRPLDGPTPGSTPTVYQSADDVPEGVEVSAVKAKGRAVRIRGEWYFIRNCGSFHAISRHWTPEPPLTATGYTITAEWMEDEA